MKSVGFKERKEFQRLHGQNGVKKGSSIAHAGLLIPKMVRNGVRNLNVSSG